MKVNNVPDWARKKRYIVCREVNGSWWFYGAWDDFEKGLKQAVEIKGQIIPECIAE